MHARVAPLSDGQRRLWFTEHLLPAPGAYHVAMRFTVTGRLDPAVLTRALTDLMGRHQPLRTGIEVRDGAPVQVIAPPGELAAPVRYLDLTGMPPDDQRERVARLADAQARTPFDLARAPLWRVAVASLSEEDHRLVLTLHHIVVDGWSMPILLRELAQLYQAHRHSTPAPPPPPVAYADAVIAREQERVAGALEEHLGYWRRQLADAPRLLELPGDRARPTRPSHRGDAVEFTLPDELRESVQALARRCRTTGFVVLLAACTALLARYTGRDDIVVGAPVANRTRPELEHLVGFLTNTVVLRTRIDPDAAFADAVKTARATVLSALDHQELPFERLVEEFAPERTLTHHPLFQVMFGFTALPEPVEVAGLRFELEAPVRTGTAKFDLSLLFYDDPRGRLGGAVEYATDLFDRATVQRLVGHLLTLLSGALADPDRPVARLPLLTGDEHRTILKTWHSTPALPAPDRPVHHLIAERARAAPDALAVRHGERALTYGALQRHAAGLAGQLRRGGAGPDTVVAVCLPRGVDLVVAELAVLTAGAAFLPLDPDNPPARLERMLRRADPLLVLVDAQTADRVPPVVDTLRMPGDGGTGEPAPAADAPVDLDHLAYVIYTSGSTGEPKGVMVSHRSLAQLVGWSVRDLPLRRTDRATVVASPGFDTTVGDIWPVLAAGASLHIPDRDTIAAPARLRDWLLAEEVTVTLLPTVLGEALLALDWPQTAPLRLMRLGGSRLHHPPSPDLPFAVLNEYGATECTVLSVAGIVPPAGGSPVDPPPVGRPLPGDEVYVLDRRMQPVPAGVTGEVYLGGVGVARGYLGAPGLTADRFVPHPWRAGARLYRTGDLGRWRSDGQLECLGRTDGQVKLRGYRIELGEIEAALTSHPAVRQAAVTLRDEQLCAYLSGTAVPAVEQVRDHLRAHLPAYMVPTRYTVLDALPLTTNGKIDRRALPEPVRAPTAAHQEPRTDLERALARLWAEVLGTDRVGVHDSFFELGGHSLALATVHARLGEVTSAEVPLVALYEHPTVAALARRLAGDPQPADTPPAHRPVAADGARVRLSRLRERRRSSSPQGGGG
jgi:amino acid adenylation domain-containing protein